MRWKVETLNAAVDAELDSLDVAFKAKFLHIAEMLETLGPNKVHEPYVRLLGSKLWEIRMKARPGIARAIYVTAAGSRIVVLHAFVKKTQKTPQSAIETAMRRKQEAKL